MYSNAAVNKSVNQTFYTVNGTIVWDPVVNSHENDFHQAQLGFSQSPWMKLKRVIAWKLLSDILSTLPKSKW